MHCNVVFKNTKQIKTPAFHFPFFPFLLVSCSPLPEFFSEKLTHNLTAREGFLLYPLNRGSHSLDAVTPSSPPFVVHTPSVPERWNGSGGAHNDQVVSVYERVRHSLSSFNHSVIPVGSSPVPTHSGFPARLVFIPIPMLWPMCSIVCRTCVFCVSMTSTHLWAISISYPSPPAYIDISFSLLSISSLPYSSKTIFPHRLPMTRTEKKGAKKEDDHRFETGFF